jgi:imidazole glycerol-phosphate synthase subunit HisH
MKVVIIKYNAGNVQSVKHALLRLGVEPLVTDEENEIRTADKVIFPGVGEASTSMRYLQDKNLHLLIPTLKQPVMGVCLGLQLMCRHSEENDTNCLGIFDLGVKKFEPILKVPHMGWNTIQDLKSPLFKGLTEESYLYFVHSYYAPVSDYTIAKTNYINDFSTALNRDNFYAVQAHPEKSGKDGALLIKNFLDL